MPTRASSSPLSLSRPSRRLWMLLLSVAAIGALAALPTSAPASTVAGTAASPLPSGVSALSPEQVEELLGDIVLGPGGAEIEVPKLARVLAELPGISDLSGVSGLGSRAALEAALTKGIEEFIADGGTLGEVLESNGLTPELEEALEEALGGTLLPIKLQLGKSPEELLGEGLGSITLTELLDRLLGETSDPTQLIERLLGAASPETLEELLGAVLKGGPAHSGTVGELASSLDTTPQALVEALGTSPEQLPESAKAVTEPLIGGGELAVLEGLKNAILGVIPERPSPTPEGGEGGTGGRGGNGASGGSANGGTGGPGGAGVTTAFTFVLPSADAAYASPTSAASSAKLGKVKILKHSVKGHTATIVVQVPSAGRRTLSWQRLEVGAEKRSQVGVHNAQDHPHKGDGSVAAKASPPHGEGRSSPPLSSPPPARGCPAGTKLSFR